MHCSSSSRMTCSINTCTALTARPRRYCRKSSGSGIAFDDDSGVETSGANVVGFFLGRVGGQRIASRHVSNRPSPNLCWHVSAHTALQTWSVVCLDRLSPCGSRPPPHGRGHLHRPAVLPHVSSITLSS